MDRGGPSQGGSIHPTTPQRLDTEVLSHDQRSARGVINCIPIMPLPRGGMVLDLTSEPSWCAVLEMAECSSPTRESIKVSLLNVGEDVIEYVVPSFPVFCVNLRRIKYTRLTTDTTVYDGFIRDVCLMGKKYPTLVVIENG